MKNLYLDYLTDILDYSKLAHQYTKDTTFKDFSNDTKTKLAVVRCLEVIGEAVKKIPIKIRNNYTEVSWKSIAGMRDKLIHEYSGVDYEIVFLTAKDGLEELIALISKIIQDSDSNAFEF